MVIIYINGNGEQDKNMNYNVEESMNDSAQENKNVSETE